MKEEIRDLRRDYHGNEDFSEDLLNPDPLAQFKIWMSEALQAGILDPNAMTLATVDARKQPQARIVLLKEINKEGFVFYTNYDSSKSQELKQDGRASLLFYWDRLARQVKINGYIHNISREESEDYFKTRPYLSQIGAHASVQSQKINNRQELEKAVEDAKKKYPENVACPANWGGKVLVPEYFEFWQGRESRLHDRIVYELSNNLWTRFRLAP